MYDDFGGFSFESYEEVAARVSWEAIHKCKTDNEIYELPVVTLLPLMIHLDISTIKNMIEVFSQKTAAASIGTFNGKLLEFIEKQYQDYIWQADCQYHVHLQLGMQASQSMIRDAVLSKWRSLMKQYTAFTSFLYLVLNQTNKRKEYYRCLPLRASYNQKQPDNDGHSPEHIAQ